MKFNKERLNFDDKNSEGWKKFEFMRLLS